MSFTGFLVLSGEKELAEALDLSRCPGQVCFYAKANMDVNGHLADPGAIPSLTELMKIIFRTK